MVLIPLYKNISGTPPIAIYSMGAITPSDAFSATVSTAAFVTPVSVSSLVSRPTIMDTA